MKNKDFFSTVHTAQRTLIHFNFLLLCHPPSTPPVPAQRAVHQAWGHTRCSPGSLLLSFGFECFATAQTNSILRFLSFLFQEIKNLCSPIRWAVHKLYTIFDVKSNLDIRWGMRLISSVSRPIRLQFNT